MDTPQNGTYVAPEDSKNVIPDMDEALIGHTYDKYGTPVLIYSVDLILDILESMPSNVELQDVDIIRLWEDLESTYEDSVVFCYT